VQGGVVEDEEADGADGGSNGGLNRRRRSQVRRGLRRSIGRLRWLIDEEKRSRRISEKRGVEWCEKWRRRSAPFIGCKMAGRGAAGRHRHGVAGDGEGLEGAGRGRWCPVGASELDGKVGDGWVGARCIQVCGGARGKMAKVSTAAGDARTRDRVRRVQGVAVMLDASPGGPGEAAFLGVARGQSWRWTRPRRPRHGPGRGWARVLRRM
jgi:hypothetical protein